MSKLPKYPGEEGTSQEHAAFSDAATQHLTETGEARQLLAIYFCGTALGERFYELSEAEQKEIEEGVAGIYLAGFRRRHSSVAAGDPPTTEVVVDPHDALLPEQFASTAADLTIRDERQGVIK